MNEEERAEWLARAIDDLLNVERQSEAANELPVGLEAEELKALMRVAKARLETARERAHEGLQYEGAVWREVLSRLDRHLGRDEPEPEVDPLDYPGDSALGRDLEIPAASWRDAGIEELREIATLRRAMAEEAASIAEQHRDAVWQRIQSRIQGNSLKTGWAEYLRRAWSSFTQPRAGPRRGGPESSDDEALNGLIRLSRERRGAPAASGLTRAARQNQLWTRIFPGLSGTAAGARPRSRLWPRRISYGFVFPAAIVALLLAAVGPIPATGLADHPAAELARFVGEHIGVIETGPPPAAPEVAGTAQGIEAGAAEAASFLGFPVSEPADPEGFERVSAQIFPHALTAAEGGMFMLGYESADASVTIYQESAGGDTLAAGAGSAFDVTLADGTPGTYVDGAWTSSTGGFAWDDAGSQTLLFERGGVRAIIVYRGPRVERAFLFAIANGMASLTTP